MSETSMGNVLMGRMLARLGDAVWGPRCCFFTFHRCAAPALWPTLPNRAFYLDTDFLDTLLGYLATNGWAVVTLDDALDRLARGDDGRFVNISVDDCYRDTVDLVAPIFRAHGVPVTLFVTTGIPDNTMALWGAGLETAIAENDQLRIGDALIQLRSAEEKRQVYAALSAAWDAAEPAAQYSAFCADNDLCEADLHTRHAITWDMLRDLRDDPCVEIGAHSISHRRLSALSDADVAEEIAGSRTRLREVLGVPCRHFAFPYGRRGDCGAREFDTARRAGFASAATTRKGLARAGQDTHSLPRNTLNGGRQGALMTEAHMLGVSGLLARASGRV